MCFFDQSERAQAPIYIVNGINESSEKIWKIRHCSFAIDIILGLKPRVESQV